MRPARIETRALGISIYTRTAHNNFISLPSEIFP